VGRAAHVQPAVIELAERRDELERRRKGWVYTSVEAFMEMATRQSKESEAS